MTFTKNIQLFFLFFLIANTSFSQTKVELPRHAEGRPIICEKFEMLEKTLPNLQSQLTNTSIQPPIIQGLNNALPRTGDDTQVGDSNSKEFEVHAAVNPTDPSNIIVGAMKVSGTDPNITLTLSIYYTNDFGDTWEKSGFTAEIPNELVIGGGDPMIVFDQTGKAYFSWVLVSYSLANSMGTWGLYYATSDNNGDTWTFNLNNAIEKETFTDIFNLSDLQEAVDKQWMVSDLTPTRPYYGSSYIAYVDIVVATGIYNLKVKRRVSGSSIFDSTPQIVSTQNYAIAQFSSIDVAANGDIYVTFFASTGGANYGIYVAKSTDGGNSFGAEQKISNIAFPEVFSGNTPIAGINDQRLYPCPHVAVDKSDGASAGNIYVTWTAYGINSQTTDGLDIYISTSADGGVTWSTPNTINNDNNPAAHQVYSSIEVTRTGIVIASWYDRRTDASNNLLTDYYMGYSTDGGQSFEQFAVTSEQSDFSQILTADNTTGIGEYNQIVTVHDYAIPFWGDGRTNDGDISVYAAFYNLVTLSTDPDKLSSLNTKFSISGPFPNPIENVATLNFILEEESAVKIKMFDLSGKLVKEFLNKNLNAGEYNISIASKNFPNGEYIVTAFTDFGISSKKIVIVK